MSRCIRGDLSGGSRDKADVGDELRPPPYMGAAHLHMVGGSHKFAIKCLHRLESGIPQLSDETETCHW